ncbi:MAG TPA: hypothetical protein VK539_10625 [Myxococcaceae bacterium]|nr:hypothetical protein [Myxococcaceae bacterium]
MRNGWKCFGVVSALVLPAVLTGCGDVGGAPPVTDVSEEVLADVRQELEVPNLTASINAATATAESSSACDLNGNFYWEIGTRHGAMASGSVVNTGGTQFNAQSYMSIASASKMVYSAYVFESCGGVACNYGTGPAAVNALRMLAGYKSTTSYCPNAGINPTVASCSAAAGVTTTNYPGYFSYSGGQFMALAQGEPHLSGLTATQLAAEVNAWLGTYFDYEPGNPWPGGGNAATPAIYAHFLQRVLLSNVDYTNGLKLHGYLGADAVDASSSTLIPEQDWFYSYGHWVENAGGGTAVWDGAFSSPGAHGFYPWISRTKKVYGVVARTGGNFFQSVRCGQAIRKAFYTAQAQP